MTFVPYEFFNWPIIMLALILLWYFANYHMKMIIYLLGSGAIVLVCIPFMIFRPRDYRNALVPAWGCRQLCKLLGVTMEVRGLENVRKDHGSVVLMNHQSCLDLCVLSYLWPVIGTATVVSKKEILYFPFFGIGSWLWGTLFINRQRKTDSINQLQRESRAINERNCKLLLFPEGTRNSEETLLPFKKGSFHIALQSKCPIQPVVISKYWFLNSEKKIFRPGHAIIHILPEINTDEYTRDNLDDLLQKTQNVMQAEFKKLNEETKPLHAIRYNENISIAKNFNDNNNSSKQTSRQAPVAKCQIFMEY